MKVRPLASALFALSGAALAASSYTLKPEWQGPCQRAAVVDVNLGNSPEAFVRSAYCQTLGKEPEAKVLAQWSERLKQEKELRRVDVIRSVAKAAGLPAPKLKYSNPWTADSDPAPAPAHAPHKRQIGAVMMFFFNCPGGVNCGMDWANNHVTGMEGPVPSLGFGAAPTGVYDPKNPGFWKRELRDAKAAGLDFVLANVYGPDMQQEGKVKTLAAALAGEADPVKIGMLDDPWAWGERYFGPFWEQRPDLNQPEKAANLIYTSKWKPFFAQIPRKHWALVDGKPLIYFYAAGKLQPQNRASATLSKLKALFKKDFGVEPFVAVETGYFQDQKMGLVADAQFVWDPFKFGQTADKLSRYTLKGKTLVHCIPRWDAIGRDKPGAIAGFGDHVLKGPEQLQKALERSRDADLLVLATWNDLGEGTGLSRSYDYWYLGRWLEPDTFIRMIAAEQAR